MEIIGKARVASKDEKQEAHALMSKWQ